jgi:hypothetical protein
MLLLRSLFLSLCLSLLVCRGGVAGTGHMRFVTTIYMSVTLRSSDAAILTGSDEPELVRR